MTHASENQDIVLEPGAAGQDENRKPWYRRWWVMVGALVLVAGIAGGAYGLHAHALSTDRQAYTAAVDDARTAFDELDGVVAQAQDLVSDCASKTGGDASCDGLADALTDLPVAEQFADGSELGRAELAAGKTEAENAAKVARERAGLLNERSEAVKAAVSAFELNSAKEALADAIEQATTARDQAVGLIGQTEGQVVDDQKRVDLQQAVNELSGLIDEAGQVNGEQTQAYRDMIAKLDQLVAGLDEPVAQVQATYQAFLAQAAQAQAEAEAAAQAQAEAQSSQRASSGGQNSKRSNRSNRSQAPAPARQPAPAPAPAKPAAPSAPQGGGWVDTSTGGNLCQRVDSEGNSWVGECP